jgi:[ribosomal protein S5]-alanine N-acetyltransferase
MSEMQAYQLESRLDMNIELGPLFRNSNVSLFLLKPELVTKDYVSWLNDPEVNQYLESRFVTHTLESSRNFAQYLLDSPVNLFLGIRSNLLNRYIGNIKVGPIDENHGVADLGIMIGDKKAWGKGIASSAVLLMMEIARERLLLRKIFAGYYSSNIGSQRLFEKSGFKVEVVRKQHFLLNGVPEDDVIVGKSLK